MLFVPKLAKLLPAAGLAALFLCWEQASQAGVIFEIEVDTDPLTGLMGTTGSLDFQFNPASGAPAATAMVYDFSSDGSLLLSSDGTTALPAPSLTGMASGDLSSGLTINNGEPGDTSFPNEVRQSFTFGSFFDVFVDLNMLPPGPGDQTTNFYLSIYDQYGNAVQDDGFDGPAAVAILPIPDGSGTFFVDSGGPTVTQQPSVIPEPSTLTLTALGLVGLAGGARRRRRTPIGEI